MKQKMIVYLRDIPEFQDAIRLERDLNEYEGICAYVNSGTGEIQFRYPRGKYTENQLKHLVRHHGMDLLESDSYTPLLLKGNERFQVVDLATTNMSANTFLGYMSSLLRKSKVVSERCIHDLAKQNHIPKWRVKHRDMIPGREISGVIRKRKIACRWLSCVPSDNGMRARLYLLMDGKTVGYTEFVRQDAVSAK